MAVWVPVVRLVEIMDDHAATGLLSEYGGMSVTIAKAPRPWLIEACGDADAAARLCAEFGGSDILLPASLVQQPTKKDKIIAMLEAGESLRECARQCRCTERYVQQVRADLRI